jgi:hypothetical protein
MAFLATDGNPCAGKSPRAVDGASRVCASEQRTDGKWPRRHPGGHRQRGPRHGGHDRRPGAAGYGAELGRHGKVRNGDAAPLPVPKRRCGATTASEAKMRRQGRNGQRRRPLRRLPRPTMTPFGRPANGGSAKARSDPKTAPSRGGSESPRAGRCGAQRAEDAAAVGAAGEDRATWGPGGIPPENTASHSEADRKAGEDRATPGGYGGKPPGVAFIGVPTGARNAGRCSDGGPEHRYACYTETPPCASRPDYRPSRRSAVFLRPATDCLHPG